MPYHLSKDKLSVLDEQGKVVKKHSSRAKARAHLTALNINVVKPELKKTIPQQAEAQYFESDIAPHLSEAQEFQGRVWDVVIIGARSPEQLITVNGQEYIKSSNGRLYSTTALAASTPQWEGVKVYDNHLTDEEFQRKQGMRSPVTEWIGTIVNPRWDEAGKKLCGTLKIVDEALAAKLKTAHEAKVLHTIGLSIDTFPEVGKSAVIEGVEMPIIEGFKKILSVDLVAEPAAGGGFSRLIAAQTIPTEEITTMDKDEIVALIRQTLAEALAADETDESVAEGEEDSTAEAKPKMPMADEMTPEEKKKMMAEMYAKKRAKAAEGQAQEALTRIAKLESERAIEKAIAEAKLTGKMVEAAQAAFADRVVSQKEIETVIKSLKEAQAQVDPSGDNTNGGQVRDKVSVTWSEADKYAVEFARLIMGNTAFNNLRESKPEDFIGERLQEADWYKTWEKQGRPDIHQASRMSSLMEQWFGGNPLLDQRAMEAATTSSLATVVKNTVNIMIAADYSIQQRWYESIVRTEEVDTIDDTTLARLYGVNTLEVVNEGAAYTELPIADEEETASFVKQGNYIGVTLETLMRDKLQFVRTIPRRLSDAWYNTLSAHVAAVFTVNTATGPQLSDTGALFNNTAATSVGGHANLLTTALGTTVTAYAAARTAMRKQTNQSLGAGRKLQIEPRYLLVPEDLETSGLTIRNSQYIPGSANNDINPYYQKFDVVVVPDWTDATDWALVADPAKFPAIFLIFPRGNRTPQLFTADSDVAGAMFTNDTMRFKVRMMHYRFSATYACAPVADFRPLHKSNVA